MRLRRADFYEQMANLYALRSTCSRAHVGCVIVKDNRVLCGGYNGAPAGMEHCAHTPADQFCTRAIHAEANAIAMAARWGMSIENATMYCTHEPCLPCSQLIVAVGILEVWWDHDYERNSGREFLREAGVLYAA